MPKLPSFAEAFLGYHYALATAVATGYGALVVWSSHRLVGHLPPPTRISLYTSLAATSGVLLGFALTAVTVLLALGPGRGLDLLRSQPEFSYTRKVLMGAIYYFAYATIIATALILVDEKHSPVLWLESLAVFVYTMAALRLWSLVWLLDRLLRLAVSDARPA